MSLLGDIIHGRPYIIYQQVDRPLLEGRASARVVKREACYHRAGTCLPLFCPTGGSSQLRKCTTSLDSTPGLCFITLQRPQE